MLKNKIILAICVVSMTTTGFTGIAIANTPRIFERNSELKEIIKKSYYWKDLSVEEQIVLEKFMESGFFEKWVHKNTLWWYYGYKKRIWLEQFTKDDILFLESMTDEERKNFFDAKKSETQERKNSRKIVIEKILRWEKLTASEEFIRLEMLAKMQNDVLPRRNHGDIIEKLLAWDELSTQELAEIKTMKEKKMLRSQKREQL